MLIYIFASIVNEIFEISAVGFGYIWSVTNISQLIQIILGLIAISPVLTGSDAPNLWQKHCTAVSRTLRDFVHF
jgi:hypothetical protein